MKFRGKELHKYSKGELIAFLEEFIKRDKARGEVPSTKLIDHEYEPPKIAGITWRGKGEPGGK